MWATKQFHILIVCALWQELQIIKSLLKWKVFQWIKFHFFVSWVGIEKTTISLTQYFSKSWIDFNLIINIWLAGYTSDEEKNQQLSRWKVVQCLRIIQSDANKELCVPPQYMISSLPIVPLVSSYRPIREISQISPFLSSHHTLVAVDMEGYAIESVCDYFDVSRMFIKVLYDEIEKDNISDLDYEDMLVIFRNALKDFPQYLHELLYTKN